MGETFYTILDVAPDADRETIRRAYREQVKDVHPDVSDDPDATETFKQLTTTRDVLLDREERRRYDRLGHDEYVRKHVNSPVWSSSTAGESRTQSDGTHGYGATAAGGETTGETTSGVAGGTWSRQHRTGRRHEAEASTGESAYGPQSSRDHQSTRRRRGTGTFVQDSWQTASEAYRRTETDFNTGRDRTLYDVGLVVRRLAPWLLVHAVLITSTLATVWFAYTSTSPETGAAVSTFVGAVALVSVVVALSAFHILSVLYA